MIMKIRVPNVFLFKVLIFFAPIVLLVQSCSNNQIGAELAKSFDSLDNKAIPNQDNKKVGISKKNKELIELKKSKKSKSNKKSREKVSADSPKNKTLSKTSRKERSDLVDYSEPFNPSPYRITIKLSGANPSAPAESVTKALRKAGVKFEVELIERVNDQKSIKITPVRSINR